MLAYSSPYASRVPLTRSSHGPHRAGAELLHASRGPRRPPPRLSRVRFLPRRVTIMVEAMSSGRYPHSANLTEVQLTTGEIELQAKAEEVWRVVGGFYDLTWFDPAIRVQRKEGVTAEQRIVHVDSSCVVNELTSRTETSYSYRLVSSQLPVTEYDSTLAVRAAGDGKSCIFVWRGTALTSGPGDGARSALEPVFKAAGPILDNRFNGGNTDAKVKLRFGGLDGDFFAVESS